MKNRNKKSELETDVAFLEEIKKYGIKWAEGNDASARDRFYALIEDWIDELEELLCE